MENLSAMLATIDPNLLYLGLIAGLWLGVTVIYLPGTGFLEIKAFVILAACLFVLSQIPGTNWLAVLLLIIGVSAFVLLPFAPSGLRQFAELGLILQAVGGYFLLADRSVSPIVIGITILLSWLYHRFALLPMLRRQRTRTEFDEASEVLGARGRVLKSIDPVGTVYVNGESWTARSRDTLLPDTEVIVTAKRGLELMVEKAKRDDTVPVPANGKQ